MSRRLFAILTPLFAACLLLLASPRRLRAQPIQTINATGTWPTTWHLGGPSAVYENANGNAIEARVNSSTYALNRSLDPVASHDDVTLGFLNAYVCPASISPASGTGLWYSSGGTLNASALTLSKDLLPGTPVGVNLPVTVVGLEGNLLPTFGANAGYLQWSGTAGGSILQLANPSGGGSTLPTGTEGDLLLYKAGVWTSLHDVAIGQFLIAGGVAADPIYSATVSAASGGQLLLDDSTGGYGFVVGNNTAGTGGFSQVYGASGATTVTASGSSASMESTAGNAVIVDSVGDVNVTATTGGQVQIVGPAVELADSTSVSGLTLNGVSTTLTSPAVTIQNSTAANQLLIASSFVDLAYNNDQGLFDCSSAGGTLNCFMAASTGGPQGLVKVDANGNATVSSQGSGVSKIVYGSNVLDVDSTGVHGVSGNTTEDVIPVGTGTVNTQHGLIVQRLGTVRTTATGFVAAVPVYVTPTNSSGYIWAHVLCRDVVANSGISVGDTWSETMTQTYANVGGTVRLLGSPTTVDLSWDASYGSSFAMLITSGGPDIDVVLENATGTPTIDCQARMTVDVD